MGQNVDFNYQLIAQHLMEDTNGRVTFASFSHADPFWHKPQYGWLVVDGTELIEANFMVCKEGLLNLSCLTFRSHNGAKAFNNLVNIINEAYGIELVAHWS